MAAFDNMMGDAEGARAIEEVKNSLCGFDTNPTVWALSTLNMFFRGDGKSHIEQGNCFDIDNRNSVRSSFTRAFLNPPFSQENEPERDFIDASLDALRPGGTLAVVVKAGIFADDDHVHWRREFVRRHTLLGVISLPEDLFYPNASAPTSILLATAHIPQSNNDDVFLARVWNDGFEKLKNRRIERADSQLPEILDCFHSIINDTPLTSELFTVIEGEKIKDGEEWSPQEWLPQPELSVDDLAGYQAGVVNSIFQAVTVIPELADEILEDFTEAWEELDALPIGEKGRLDYFFDIMTGKSTGEKNYPDGSTPYISSGDLSNSIVRLVQQEDDQCFNFGGITVTAFGKAYVQPWSFMARGNGGSAVRVLIPKYKMSFRELVWFSAQINAQQWRFFYARMAIKSRLTRLEVESPPESLDDNITISERVREFRQALSRLSMF